MPPRRATLVLSGGGAKGAFQVGAEQVLRTEGSFTWERIFGVSVGALNGALLSQQGFDRITEIWRTIREQDIYKKVGWFKVAWRLALQHKTGLYDGTPLRHTIDRYIADRPFKTPFHAGRVSLTSGEFELVSSESAEIVDAVWESATMPVIWEPIGPRALVDGGLRNVTPLGDALKFDCTEIVVIVCSPSALEPAPRPTDILATLKRSLADIAINEIFLGDLREFLRINRLVTEAAALGHVLKDSHGVPYRHCPIHVLRPREPLGDSLDFSRAAIERRITAGISVAREWLAYGAQ